MNGVQILKEKRLVWGYIKEKMDDMKLELRSMELK